MVFMIMMPFLWFSLLFKEIFAMPNKFNEVITKEIYVPRFIQLHISSFKIYHLSFPPHPLNSSQFYKGNPL